MSFNDNKEFTSSYIPCKGCVAPTRHPGCHDTCELYMKWKEEYDDIKHKIKVQRDNDLYAKHMKPIRKKRRK